MKKLFLSAALMASTALVSTATLADGSMQHFAESAQHVGQTAKHSVKSVKESVVGSTKLVSGVVAVPFKGVGHVGKASEAVGDFLWEKATGQEELEVSEVAVTAGPSPMVAVNH